MIKEQGMIKGECGICNTMFFENKEKSCETHKFWVKENVTGKIQHGNKTITIIFYLCLEQRKIYYTYNN